MRIIKLLAMLCIAALFLSNAWAEPMTAELVVGSTTPLSGNFFGVLWGNNLSDVDARSLIEGYSLAQWDEETDTYAINPLVVDDVTERSDGQGNKTYAFTLSQELRFSDGTPVTAADYAFSLLLRNSPELAEAGIATNRTEHIQGATEYLQGAADTLQGVRLPDADSLEITIDGDYLPFFYEPALLGVVPYPVSAVAPGCAVKDDGAGVFIENATPGLLSSAVLEYRSRPSVSSGPYTLAEYDAAAGVARFAANPMYEGDIPAISRITFKHVANDDAARLLESGELDLMHRLTSAASIDAATAYARESGKAEAASYARAGLTLVSFCCERGPAQSAKVRRALACGFNRAGFVAEQVGDYGVEVNGLYGMGQWMPEYAEGEIAGIAFDLDEAEALLIEDGWTLNAAGEEFDPAKDSARAKMLDGEIVPLEMTLVAGEGGAGDALRAFFADELARIGVRILVREAPFGELLAMYYGQAERACDMIYLGTDFGAVFDPADAYAVDGAFNTTRIRDERLEKLAVDMRRTEPGDAEAYYGKWVAFQEYWAEVLPAIPVYSNQYYDVYTGRLRGYDIGACRSWTRAVRNAWIEDK